MLDKKPFKLNLWAIIWKKTNDDKNKTSKDSNTELERVKKIEKTSNEIKDPNEKKIDLSNMLNKKEKLDQEKRKQEEEKMKQEKEREKERQEKDKKLKAEKQQDLFANYKSEFNREKTSILEKFKKIKDYIKPKTRLGFVMIVIIPSTIVIAILFIIAPEIHNLKNYKNNLIKAKEALVCKVSLKKCLQYEKQRKKLLEEKNKLKKQKELKKNPKTEETTIEKTLKKLGFTINYKVKNIDGKEIIIYKENQYKNMESFNKEIEKEIKNSKKNKLKKFIINNK